MNRNEALVHILTKIIHGAWDQTLILTLIAVGLAFLL